MTTSGEWDYKICFSIITDPLNRIGYSFLKKYAHEKHLLDIKIRLNNKVKCTVLEKTIIAKFGVIENFYSGLPRIHIGSKELTRFSRLKGHITRYGSDLQTLKHDVLENHGLQISGISRLETPSMLFSSGPQHLHLHHFFCQFTMHNICGYIFAVGQITDRIRIWSTNFQTRCTWKPWLVNLRNFSATDTFYASFHWGTALTFAPGFVVNFTIHTICGYIIAVGQITHRIPSISEIQKVGVLETSFQLSGKNIHNNRLSCKHCVLIILPL